MTENTTPQNDEIDLGNLFKVIGKGFSNLFKAIGGFFKAIFHYFILLLIFLRKNILKLGIAIVLGAILGYVLDSMAPKKYTSTMIVEPNFKSTQQLYNNINFFNELVKQKDTVLLSEILGINVVEASKLKGFFIEPIKNENEKYEMFNNFIEEVDTTTVKNIDIESFKKAFTIYDYRYHKIKVKAISNTIFERLSTPIVNSIESNSYFKNQKLINDQNLMQNEKVLQKSLIEVDTLRKIYNEVLIKEADKAETGTSITLAEGTKKTSELELFGESLRLNKELIENNKEKAETTEIVNVVSNFSIVGAEERSLFKKYTFWVATFFMTIMLLIILLRQLDIYLLSYSKK